MDASGSGGQENGRRFRRVCRYADPCVLLPVAAPVETEEPDLDRFEATRGEDKPGRPRIAWVRARRTRATEKLGCALASCRAEESALCFPSRPWMRGAFLTPELRSELAARLLEPDRDAVPGRVQRERPEVLRHLPRAVEEPDADQKDLWVLLIGFLFSAPFILFSMTGGFLADRFSKRVVTIGTKMFEIGVMLFAAFAFTRETITLSFAAVFLASTQAALFGPSKYGLLPELLPPPRLSWGNGVLELDDLRRDHRGRGRGADPRAGVPRPTKGWSGLMFARRARARDWRPASASREFRRPTRRRRFRLNVFGDLWEQWRLVRPDRVFALAVAGNTYFWFLGALLQFNIVFYGEDVLHARASRTAATCRRRSRSASASAASPRATSPAGRSSTA